MNWRKTKRCEHITEWLMVATKDLCGQARARITLEIETHYKEAVEAHLADGESLADAEARALEELGDAKPAGRRFRRRHLTEREALKLQNMEKEARKRPSTASIIGAMLMVIGLVGGCFVKGPPLSGPQFNNLLFLWISLPAYFCKWASFLSVRSMPSKSAVRLLLSMRPFSDAIGVAIIVFFMFWFCHLPLIISVSGFLLLYAMTLRSWCCTWQKAKNDGCL